MRALAWSQLLWEPRGHNAPKPDLLWASQSPESHESRNALSLCQFGLSFSTLRITHFLKQILFYSLSGNWGNWKSERVSNLSKDAQLRLEHRSVWPSNLLKTPPLKAHVLRTLRLHKGKYWTFGEKKRGQFGCLLTSVWPPWRVVKWVTVMLGRVDFHMVQWSSYQLRALWNVTKCSQIGTRRLHAYIIQDRKSQRRLKPGLLSWERQVTHPHSPLSLPYNCQLFFFFFFLLPFPLSAIRNRLI
jgi:hypothetical protein